MESSDAPALDAPVLALVSTLASTNELFKQFIKAYLESQTPALVQTELLEQFFKACFPDL